MEDSDFECTAKLVSVNFKQLNISVVILKESCESATSVLLFSAISQASDVSNVGKESSTIVVTSIAPPSATPIHGTPSSASISPVISNATGIETKVFIGCAITTFKATSRREENHQNCPVI